MISPLLSLIFPNAYFVTVVDADMSCFGILWGGVVVVATSVASNTYISVFGYFCNVAAVADFFDVTYFSVL